MASWHSSSVTRQSNSNTSSPYKVKGTGFPVPFSYRSSLCGFASSSPCGFATQSLRVCNPVPAGLQPAASARCRGLQTHDDCIRKIYQISAKKVATDITGILAKGKSLAFLVRIASQSALKADWYSNISSKSGTSSLMALSI